MTYRTKLPYLFAPAILALALPAFSQDGPGCANDADCGSGYSCVKSMSTSGCDPGAASCDAEVTEAEFGSCEKLPEECETDEDCGEYLGCASSDSGVCWQDSDGTSGCSEPDPDAPKYCAPAAFECETDDDCPRSFECMVRENCVTNDCPEGANCEQAACEPSEGQCVPKEIDCESESDCPTDWSCEARTIFSCSGSGGGTEPAPAPEPDPNPYPDPQTDIDDGDGSVAPPDGMIPEDTCTKVETVGACQPPGWEDLGWDDALGDGGGTTKGEVEGPQDGGSGDEDGVGQAASGDESSSDAGGCSVTTTRSGSSGLLGLLFVLAAPFVFLRRRYARGVE